MTHLALSSYSGADFLKVETMDDRLPLDTLLAHMVGIAMVKRAKQMLELARALGVQV